MKVHNDGLVEFLIKKGITLSAGDVWLSRDLSRRHLPEQKFIVLTEAEDDFRITQDARHAGASAEYAEHVLAHAMFTNNLSLKIVSNLFIKVSRPVVPTRFFDEREKALQWLRTFQEKS